MNSINQNQPEQNRKDLRGREAIQKIQQLVKAAPNCFFCTAAPDGEHSRPMNVRQVDDNGQLWFLSASDSHTNAEIGRDGSVTLYFQGTTHSDFLRLDGQAVVATTKAKIRELWEPILATWFTGGIEDPRITVLQVTPTDGYYWDTKHGNMVAGIKMLVGSLIGQTLDDSIEGSLKI